MAKYRCTICGYVYEPGVPFADLPEDWVCPICQSGKSMFEPVEEQVKAAAAPVTRTYTNGEISVLWQPALCNHNGNCWRRLPEVFDPKARPWVNIHGADSAKIAEVVGECPTGALSCTWVKKDQE
jgi:uncharacterized Fe-S cluster protein YjdI/rubredoxin